MDKYLTRSESFPSLVNKRPREDTTSPDQRKQPKNSKLNLKNAAEDFRTSTSNSFSALPVEEDLSDLFQNASKKKSVNNTPPILIELDGEWTHEKARNTLEKYVKYFHVQHRGRKIMKVQCYSANTHQQLKEGLIKENMAFHTFTRNDEKYPKVVIKGLPKFVHCNIPKELASMGFSGATVSEIKTLHPTECPPVLVLLPTGTNMAKFKQIKYLSNCVISVERYKPSKKSGTQCFRCQGFGHASRNCNRPPRCVKCAQPHLTSECSKKDRVEPALCCNCQQNHPANFSQCGERLKYINRMVSKRETTRKSLVSQSLQDKPSTPKTWSQVTIAGTNKKYDQVPNLAPTTIPTNNAPVWLTKPTQQIKLTTNKPQAQPSTYAGATSAKNSHDYDTMEMLEILGTIQAMKQEFSKCKTFMEKVILILTHLGHYV